MPSNSELMKALAAIEPGLDTEIFLNDRNALQMMLNAANVEKNDLIETLLRTGKKPGRKKLNSMSNDQLRTLLKHGGGATA